MNVCKATFKSLKTQICNDEIIFFLDIQIFLSLVSCIFQFSNHIFHGQNAFSNFQMLVSVLLFVMPISQLTPLLETGLLRYI